MYTCIYIYQYAIPYILIVVISRNLDFKEHRYVNKPARDESGEVVFTSGAGNH